MGVSGHDLERLRAAVALARRGFFGVEPNPPVGCVIEDGRGRVVGEGFHAAYGGPHAEIAALEAAGCGARGATAYVSLAPCGRHGKTAPCADALQAAGVSRVVFAADDPDPDERGAGVARLRAAGLAVDGPVGDLDQESDALLARFRAALDRPRPWTLAKWAMSADGCIAARRGSGGRISSEEAGRRTHLWRGHADAIAVGIETVLADDPRLTCRLPDGPPHDRPQPRRIVFDSALRTPATARLVAEADLAPVWIFAGAGAAEDRRRALEEVGCRVLEVPRDGEGLDLAAAWTLMHEEGVRRLLVEGGARIHGSLFQAALVDQVAVFVAPSVLGGADPVRALVWPGGADPASALRLEEARWEPVGEDMLLLGYVAAARSGAGSPAPRA